MGRTKKAAVDSSDTKDLDAKSRAIEKAKARTSREKAQKSYREPSDSEESEKEVAKFVDPKDKDFSEDEEVSVSEQSESDYAGESSGSEYGKKKKTPTKIAKGGRGRAKGGKKATASPKGRGRGRGRPAAAASRNGSKRTPAKRKADSEDESESEADSSGSEYGKKKVATPKKRGPPAKASPKKKKVAASPPPSESRARRGRPAKNKSYKEVSEDEEMEVSEEEKKPVSKRAKIEAPKSTKVEKKKKDESEKSESEEDEQSVSEDEKDEVDEKPAKRDEKAKKNGTSQKKVVEKEDSEDEEDKESKKTDDEESEEETPKKEKEKSPVSEEEEEDEKAAVGLKNRTDTDYSKIDFECDKKTPKGDSWNYKISCWNIGGIKSWLKKNGLEYLKEEKPDVMCLNEIKCNEKTKPEELSKIEGYPHTYWSYNTEHSGQAGVAVLSKTEAVSVQYGFPVEESDSAEDKKVKENFNKEGRLITVEYENHYILNAYVPNSGKSERNDDYPKGYPIKVANGERIKFDKLFREHVKVLNEKKPVIITGDLNVAHEEIDLANPKTNERNAGFTKEERDDFTKLLEEDKLIDSFRTLYPEKKASYSFWSYKFNSREKNVGWRLDYFLLSDKLKDSLCESLMRTEVYGSDHCPIVLFIKN